MIDAAAYGRALFELAAEAGQDETLGEELSRVCGLLEQNSDYVKLMDTPAVPTEEKLGLLRTAFGGAENELLMNFLSILCEKRAFRCLPDCAAAYVAAGDEAHGRVRATAVTAVPMRPEQLRALTGKLAEITGKTVVLENTVDPAIISGVVLRCGSIQLDDSIKSRLDALRRGLRETIV